MMVFITNEDQFLQGLEHLVYIPVTAENWHCTARVPQVIYLACRRHGQGDKLN